MNKGFEIKKIKVNDNTGMKQVVYTHGTIIYNFRMLDRDFNCIQDELIKIIETAENLNQFEYQFIIYVVRPEVKDRIDGAKCNIKLEITYEKDTKQFQAARNIKEHVKLFFKQKNIKNRLTVSGYWGINQHADRNENYNGEIK